MKKTLKILAAGCFLALTAFPVTAYASISWETDSSVAGAAVALNNYYAASMNPEAQLADAIGNEGLFAVSTSPRTDVPVVTATASAYSNVAISHVSNYVNVRTEPNTGSSIVGKIYNNCAATILATVDGEGGKWYQIQSGSVNGYIKAEYFITGTDAEKIAKQVGTTYAKITNADTLRLREEPNLTSRTLTLLSQDAEYLSLGEEGDFVKIQVDSDLVGYVHKDYVESRVEFKQAVSLEEEAAKQAEEEKLKQEAADAIAKLEEARKEAESSASGGTSETPAETSGPSAAATAPETAAETETASQEIGTIARNPLDTGDAAPETTAAPTAATVPETTAAPESTTASSTMEIGPGGSMGPGADPSGSQTGSSVETATRTAIVAYAKQFLGNPYVYGGTSLTNGADCSGFTMRVYEHFGIDVGRTSRDQAANGKEISIDAVQPGDLLFYGSGDYINHVAMYIGGGQVIHSSTPATGITIAPSNYRTPCKAVTFLN